MPAVRRCLIERRTSQRLGAVRLIAATSDPVILTFGLTLTGGRGIGVDYCCLTILVLPFSVYCADSHTHTHRQNHRGGSMLYSRDYRQ